MQKITTPLFTESYPLQMEWMSEQSNWMNLVKWKISLCKKSHPCYRDTKCVSVCLSVGINWINFWLENRILAKFPKSVLNKTCIIGLVMWPQGAHHQVPDLAKVNFRGSYLLCEFVCYEVATYHFGNLSTSPTTI